MNQPIHTILQQLGDAISTQLTAANDRADAAEVELQRLREGLRVLVSQPPQRATPVANAPHRPSSVPDGVISGRDLLADTTSRRETIPDQPFLDALTSSWQSAHAIRKALLASGRKVAYGTIYARLAKLTMAFPDMIEVAVDPARWRLRAPSYAECVDKAHTEAGAGTTKISPAMPRCPVRRAAAANPMKEAGSRISSANDDAIIPASACCSGRATMYNGDCLQTMRRMASRSVDLVFTSPPYNLRKSTGGGMGRRSLWAAAKLAHGYASYGDDRDRDDYVSWQKDVLLECWRLLSDEGAIFYNHKPRVQGGLLQTPLDLNPGLPLRQIIIWHRNNGMNFSRSFFLPTHEWIVVFAKPGFRLREGASSLKDVWSIAPERGNDHPAPFPVELAQRAIESTSARVVLDPFSGSGSTAVAALRCNRRFVGIEIDPGYHSDSCERLRMEEEQAAA